MDILIAEAEREASFRDIVVDGVFTTLASAFVIWYMGGRFCETDRNSH